MSELPLELIVYACPTGPLADELAAYFAATRQTCGPNAAHNYMPHVTLTGFFHDTATGLPIYLRELEAALVRAQAARPPPPLTITRLHLDESFHYLKIESDWVKALIADFAAHAVSPTRIDDLRLKDWLHLSLAYHFQAEQHPSLAELARLHVNPQTPVSWELRFYERRPDQSWCCHASWSLGPV